MVQSSANTEAEANQAAYRRCVGDLSLLHQRTDRGNAAYIGEQPRSEGPHCEDGLRSEEGQATLFLEDDQQLRPGCEDGGGVRSQRQGGGDLSSEVEP